MTDLEKIEGIAEELGTETRSYSGRGMFGKECVGITVFDPYQVVYLARDFDLGIPEVDNMGRDYIVYWPHISP